MSVNCCKKRLLCEFCNTISCNSSLVLYIYILNIYLSILHFPRLKEIVLELVKLWFKLLSKMFDRTVIFMTEALFLFKTKLSCLCIHLCHSLEVNREANTTGERTQEYHSTFPGFIWQLLTEYIKENIFTWINYMKKYFVHGVN